MPIVVGITLRTAGKLYYFDPGNDHFYRGERVLVETARGLELGTVKLPPHEVTADQIVPPLKRVIRRANVTDISRDALNRERESQALEVCKRLVTKLNLPMRLIDAQYTFDGSNVLIHFLADDRVDFRELVRELARELRTRIELRQVGVRDEAKLLGGHGVCGRSLCCSSFLTNFGPVAINLAKEQGLALNPQKISGMCGRLMCCLAFEHECYKELANTLPRVSATVVTPRGTGKVTKLNVLARQVEVTIPDLPGPVWFAADDLGAGKAAQPCAPAAGGCGGCCGNHATEDGAAAPLDEVLGMLNERPDIAMAAPGISRTDDPAQDNRRPPRRRRGGRKPASAPEKPHAPAKVEQTAERSPSNAPGGHNRPRPHKARPAKAPVPAAAPMPSTAPQQTGNPGEPAQRYRPQRRR